MPDRPHPDENPTMQAFIAQSRPTCCPGPLTRSARAPTTTSPRRCIVSPGTLGTYQLLMAHDACRDLEIVAQRADTSTADIVVARADTLARLEQIAEDLPSPEASEVPE